MYEEARRVELCCYDLLKKYQGVFVPRQLPDTAFKQRNDLMFVLNKCDPALPYHAIFEWVGPLVGGHYRWLPQAAWELMEHHVKCLHEAGVAHNDLGENNFSYDVDSHRLYIYDFSDAFIKDTREGVEDKGFQEACEMDWKSVRCFCSTSIYR